MAADKSEVLQGTLDLMILKTLHALGPQHGVGIAPRIEPGFISIGAYQRTTGRPSSTRSQSAGLSSLRLRRQAEKQFRA